MHTILLGLCDYYRDQYRVLTQSVSLSFPTTVSLSSCDPDVMSRGDLENTS